MANTKSALKALRVAERRRQRNRGQRSAIKTSIRQAEKLAAEGQEAAAAEAARLAVRALDKAAGKGIVHPNNAARCKSRLMKKLHRAQATSGS